MMSLLSGAFVLLTNAFRPDSSRVGLILARTFCEELLSDIASPQSTAVMSKAGRVQSDDDLRHLRFALFEAVSHARGQSEAIARIAIFDRRVLLTTADNVLSN